MKKLYYISVVILGFLSLIGANAQYDPFTICAGQQNVRYTISGDEGSAFIWDGFPNGAKIVEKSETGDTIYVNWNVNPGNYVIWVYETKSSGCKGNNIYANVTVGESIDPFYDDAVCVNTGEALVPDNVFKSYEWNSSVIADSIQVLTEQLVRVAATDELGCVVNDSIYVYISKQVDLGDNIKLSGAEVKTINVNGDFIDHYWIVDGLRVDDQSVTAVAKDTKIIAVATDVNGCESIDTLLVSTGGIQINPQNVITPNGDEKNDTWVVLDNIDQRYPNTSVEIFDRWGRIVYKNDHYDNTFDGTDMSGRKLPMDAYQFIINFNTENADVETGSITIVR